MSGSTLDLGDMRAVGERRRLGAELARRAQLLGLRLRTRGKIGEGDGAVGAGDAHRAVGDFHVAGRRFERVGGELLELVGERLRGAVDGTPPTGIELEPPVPAPVAMRSVSPCTTRTRSGGKSSRSATSCA